MNSNIPEHIAIILDGNRRWAKSHNLPPMTGHKKGFEHTLDIIYHAQKLGIKILTLYAFSTENWQRPKKEVDFLMKLFSSAFDKHGDIFNKKNIRLVHLGDKTRLQKSLIEKIEHGVDLTKNNDSMTVQLAINYGGRDEIRRMIKRLIQNKIEAENITDELISDNLDSAGISDPDLIIRTSGEKRISDFLLWQSAYAELYFCDKMWPDFKEEDLDVAIAEFQNRQRRFGK